MSQSRTLGVTNGQRFRLKGVDPDAVKPSPPSAICCELKGQKIELAASAVFATVADTIEHAKRGYDGLRTVWTGDTIPNNESFGTADFCPIA
jgi:hypothetical protein